MEENHCKRRKKSDSGSEHLPNYNQLFHIILPGIFVGSLQVRHCPNFMSIWKNTTTPAIWQKFWCKDVNFPKIPTVSPKHTMETPQTWDILKDVFSFSKGMIFRFHDVSMWVFQAINSCQTANCQGLRVYIRPPQHQAHTNLAEFILVSLHLGRRSKVRILTPNENPFWDADPIPSMGLVYLPTLIP